MSSRYQTVFTILGDDTQGLALLDDVRDFVRNAIADQFGNPQSATADEGEWNNINGHLEIDADRRDHSGFFTLSWKRPDDWELRWRLSTQGDAVEVDVQVVGPDGSGRTAGPPRLLTDILERYTCRLHGEDLPYEAVRISRENANWYANSVVFNPDRRIPVVAISEQHQGGTGGKLDRALLYLRGVALIVTTSDSDSRLINRGLGRLACSGGEIRVYRPGATRNDVQELHRKWRPNDVDFGEIRDECMHLLLQSDRPRLYHDVREEIFRLWDAELAEAEEEEDSIPDERVASLESKLAEVHGSLSLATSERDNWQAKHEALQWESGREVKRLEKDLHDASRTIDELLDQINTSSPAETVIGQMREQISDLRSELDRRNDQSENVARLANELDEAKKSFQDLSRDYRSVVDERDSLQRQMNEVASAGTDKHAKRRGTAKLRDELKEKDIRIKDLREISSNLEGRNRELQGELAKRSQELEEYLKRREPSFGAAEEAADAGDEPEYSQGVSPTQPKSVFEVVRQHQDLPNIRFLQSAFDSAESSPYQHLNLLDAALRAVSECGVARATGPLGMTVEQWFRQEPEGPIDYKPRESGQTNTRHPRIWEDDRCGQELNMQEHIALGGGGARDPKDVLRIHMAWCENERAWVIGHVGRHLDIATS